MTEELQVVKGEKVGKCWGRELKIVDVYTVVSVSKKGTITVETSTGRRYQYANDGWSKGEASGKIRTLEEGEEEQFIAEERMEWEEVNRKHQERNSDRIRKLEKCRKWVNKWAVLHKTVKAVNCDLHIVSLSIPNEPCTLVLRFDESGEYRRDEYRYSISIDVHRSERGYSGNLGKRGHISGGHASTNSAEIVPLETAAEWMSVWVDVDKLGEEDAAG